MKMEHAASVFSVANLEASLRFYCEILGFTEDFRVGSYAGIQYGAAAIHLTQDYPLTRPAGSGAIYIFCDNVDDYYSHVAAKGARIKTEPQVWPYGMKDFVVCDPDGNELTFGQPIAHDA